MLPAPQCLVPRGPDGLRSVAVIGVVDVRARSRSESERAAWRAEGKVGRGRGEMISSGREWQLSDQEIQTNGHNRREGYG